ncbi:MAG: hypothetical protein IJO46_02545, partial [Thermoguttaceae bacterium]|nr:hypothetical protein [Thermoguttaceae bacterium]
MPKKRCKESPTAARLSPSSKKRQKEVQIHPLAFVGPNAKIGRDVQIGPFCVVEDGATIGDGCILEARVSIKKGVVLGKN